MRRYDSPTSSLLIDSFQELNGHRDWSISMQGKQPSLWQGDQLP